jgi:hypothetical protein
MPLQLDMVFTVGGLPTSWELRPIKVSTRQAGTPWDTFGLLAIWAYCGGGVLTHPKTKHARRQSLRACSSESDRAN